MGVPHPPPSFDRVLSAPSFTYLVLSVCLSAPSFTYRLFSPLPEPIVCATPATYTLESVKSQRTQLVAAPTPSSLSDAKLGEWEASADAFAASVLRHIVAFSSF